MAKKIVRLTESDLHRIIKESVNKILKENEYVDYAIDPRRKKEEEEAAWEAFENTYAPSGGDKEYLSTYLDDDDFNKSHYKFTKGFHHNATKGDWTRDSYLPRIYHDMFAKDADGFDSMHALKADSDDSYFRNGRNYSNYGQ